MSATEAQSQGGTRLFAVSRREVWQRAVVRFIRNKPLGSIGAGILLVMVLCAIFAPFIAPEDPHAVQGRLRLQPPNETAPFGRDGLGRDVLSRIIYGAQVSTGIGFGAVVLSTVIKTF